MWYVDDNKFSHVDKDVITDFIEMLKEQFGEITITRGKHNFLGMNIEIKDKNDIEIEMEDQLNEAVGMFEGVEGE